MGEAHHVSISLDLSYWISLVLPLSPMVMFTQRQGGGQENESSALLTSSMKSVPRWSQIDFSISAGFVASSHTHTHTTFQNFRSPKGQPSPMSNIPCGKGWQGSGSAVWVWERGRGGLSGLGRSAGSTEAGCRELVQILVVCSQPWSWNCKLV